MLSITSLVIVGRNLNSTVHSTVGFPALLSSFVLFSFLRPKTDGLLRRVVWLFFLRNNLSFFYLTFCFVSFVSAVYFLIAFVNYIPFPMKLISFFNNPSVIPSILLFSAWHAISFFFPSQLNFYLWSFKHFSPQVYMKHAGHLYFASFSLHI